MKASRIIAPLAAVLLGLSMATYAAGGGGGGGDRGGGGGGGGDRGGDRGSERGEKAEKAEKAEQHKGGDDAKGKAEQHKHGTEKDDAKGKRSAADQLAAHPQLADRLSKLSGMSPADLKAAAAGFKNVGQFTAAVHVSQNLGISFDKLRAEMAANGGSLGKAIKTLSPKANAETEENKANRQAQDDLKQTS